MAFNVYCIEVSESNQDKAEKIMGKYCDNGYIDVKSLNPSRRNGISTVQYWFTCICDEELDAMADELRENGIEIV